MKRPCLTTCLIAALFLASPARAQEVQPGDRIFVTDQHGVQTEGRLLRLSPNELALMVGGQELVIPPKSIGRIEKRDSVWNGMLIVAVPFALIGGGAVAATCSRDCGQSVISAMLTFGAVGAGAGALADRGIRGYSIVDGPPLASPHARSPAPVTAPNELWRRVRQADRIRVTTFNGQKVTGKFIEASSTSVALMVDGRRREIPSTEVRDVTRAGNRHRRGALWGGAILATAGFLSSVSCSEGNCGDPLLAALFSGSGGVALGAAIGAAIPKHPVVYASGGSRALRLTPIMGRDRVGMAFSATF